MSGTTKQPPQHRPDDIVVWPDGFYATLEEVRRGEFSHRSDDFEIVRLEDVARLKELGLAEDFDLS